ncbi:unnamed protein product [Toxocara canis]|uniref:VPS13 domain-containing protein n=1 Tax=Toxocara canis TaxID=6265 RepID=A0A183V3B6_TOXCA|nr:unnamed protein product [Toxocara canis]
MEEGSPKSATKKEVQIVRKLIVMRNLGVYWNELSTLISDLTDQNEIKCLMQTGMAMNGGKCSGYKYVLEPTTAEMKLLLNRKPEADETNWQTPKLDFSLQMQTLVLRISKTQYQDLLLFLEAQERFGLAAKYSKYRPSLDQYHGHYKQW